MNTIAEARTILEARIHRLREERREKFRTIRREGYEQREAHRRAAATT